MKKAFTLVELLVVIAVIGILSAIITPNLLNARNSARIAAGQRFDSSTYHSIGDYLVGEWMFDVPSSSLIDTSGMGNSGSTSSYPVYYQTGGYNSKGAFYFDGTDDYMSISNISLTNQSFTLSAWAKREGTGTYDIIFGQGTSWADQGLHFGFRDYNVFTFAFYSNDLDTTQAYTDNNWHLWVGTYNADTKERIIYFDGKNVRSGTASGNYIGSGTFKIGHALNTATSFIGYIDDVRVYGTALSSSEIEKLYAEGVASHGLTSN